MRCFFYATLLLSLAGGCSSVFAQTTPKSWQQLISEPVIRFADVESAYEQAYSQNPDGDYSHYHRWVAMVQPYLDANGVYDAAKVEARLIAARNERDRQSTNKAATANWQLLGPTTNPSDPMDWGNIGSGRIDAIAFHPTNPNTFYAGSPSGGLWKTTNGGTSWTFLSQSWPSLGVSAIVVDPVNPATIYAATGDRDSHYTASFGIQKSADAGLTWTTLAVLNNPAKNKRLLLSPANNNVLLLATDRGIYKSTNGGTSWAQAGGTDLSMSFNDMEFKPGDPNTVYAITGGRFFKSVNGGSSFVEVTGTGINSTNTVQMAIMVTAADPNRVIIANGTTTLEGIYRSTDSGTSFTKVAHSTSIPCTGGSCPMTNYVGQTGYTWTFAVSPTNANELWFGTIELLKSTDGGINWQHMEGNNHVDIHSLVFQPGTNRLFVCNDGGIERAPISGAATFDILHNGISVTQIWKMGSVPHATGPVYLGLQDNGVYQYQTGAFTGVLAGDGNEQLVDPTNPQIVYSSRNAGGITKSVDGGNIWNPTPPSPRPPGSAWVMPFVMNPANPKTLLAGYGQIYKTTNGGVTWIQAGVLSSVSPGITSVQVIRYAPSNPAVIYAGRSDLLAVSNNGGNTWTTLPLPVTSFTLFDICVSSANADQLWVTFLDNGQSKYHVFTSSNGGTSWTDYTGILPNVALRSLVYQTGSNSGLYIATDVGVYYRNASLSDWQPFDTGMPNVRIHELEITYAGGGKLRAATFGRGLWETALYANGVAGTPAIALGTVETAYCTSQLITVPLSATGTFGAGNQFQVQLSDANGVFSASPTAIGSGTASPVSCTLNPGLPTGSGYRLRVVSTSPALISNQSNAFLIASQPAAPTISSLTASAGSSVTLLANGCSGAGAIQWFRGAENTPAAAGSLFVPPGYTFAVGYQAECRIGVCSSVRSNSIGIPGSLLNCVPLFNPGCLNGNGLRAVQLNNVMLSTNSGCSPGGYGEFTATSTTLIAGTAYPFSLTFIRSNYFEGVTIWADLNRNDRYESSEILFQTPSAVTASVSGSLTIPAGTTVGSLPLRIILTYNSIPSQPCSLYGYGEAEDYVLTVGAPVTTCAQMFTTKNGFWNDPTVWSCNRVPTATDDVEIRHIVALPSGIAHARRVVYKPSGKLIKSAGSVFRLGL